MTSTSSPPVMTFESTTIKENIKIRAVTANSALIRSTMPIIVDKPYAKGASLVIGQGHLGEGLRAWHLAKYICLFQSRKATASIRIDGTPHPGPLRCYFPIALCIVLATFAPAILSCTIAESAVARAREYSSTCQTSPSYPTFMRMRPSAGAVGAPWFSSGRRRSENQLFTVFTLAEEKFRKSRSPKSNRHLSLNE